MKLMHITIWRICILRKTIASAASGRAPQNVAAWPFQSH